MTRIIIIGGGPAAVSTCLHMVEEYRQQKLYKPLEILVIEKGDKIGPGLPFSKSNAGNILNIHKDKMEPIFGTKGRFTEWLKSRADAPQDTNFPPRRFFGEYLAFLAERVRVDAANLGISIQYKTNCTVTDVDMLGNAVKVATNEGSLIGDYLVLCTGTMPSSSYSHLINKVGYFHNPNEEKCYEKIDINSDIAVIGTRLTAIDTVLKLLANGHRGKITMVSRSGLLPAVASKDIPDYRLKHLTSENFHQLTDGGSRFLSLSDLAKLAFNEINEAEGKILLPHNIVRSYQDLLPEDWLIQQIARAEYGPKPWQQVLTASYSLVPVIWSMLSLQDKKKFLHAYKGTYLTYLASFPLENAYKIRGYLASGQLSVRGGIKEITGLDDGGFSMSFDAGRPLMIKTIINATGPGSNPRRTQPYERMIEKKLIQPHELAGIAVDCKTLQVISPRMGRNPRIFAIGGVTAGDYLATEHIVMVARQAAEVSKGIVSRISSASNRSQFSWHRTLFQSKNAPIACAVGFGLGTIAANHFRSGSEPLPSFSP